MYKIGLYHPRVFIPTNVHLLGFNVLYAVVNNVLPIHVKCTCICIMFSLDIILLRDARILYADRN
jgi:hypothetical protein